MKRLAWLIPILLLMGCDFPSVTYTVTKDGKKALLIETEGANIKCLTMAGQRCPFGFEIIQQENYNFYSHSCTVMVACHDKFASPDINK